MPITDWVCTYTSTRLTRFNKQNIDLNVKTNLQAFQKGWLVTDAFFWLPYQVAQVSCAQPLTSEWHAFIIYAVYSHNTCTYMEMKELQLVTINSACTHALLCFTLVSTYQSLHTMSVYERVRVCSLVQNASSLTWSTLLSASFPSVEDSSAVLLESMFKGTQNDISRSPVYQHDRQKF